MRTPPPLPAVPPPAQPLKVQVRRGETAEIALRIFGQNNEALKYLIRTKPRYGKVTEPKVAGREVSTVVYSPPADLEVSRDRFTYAVQNSVGVSAAVDVLITITDQPPELALPGAQDFGSMLAGQSAAKSIEIRNRGGGRAEGKVEVGGPWRIEGSASYRLGAGERVEFKVVFAPAAGGDFESAVRFTSQPETSVLVRGTALAALVAAPTKLMLQNAVGDPVRTGTFELTNQTDTERRARLSGGERLQLPAEVTVPALGKVSVTAQTAAADVAVLTGEVRIESEGLTLRVPVTAPQSGGIVRASRPGVAFGRVESGKTARASFELENIGGAPAQVRWEIAAPFSTEESGTVLAPGEKKVFALRTEPTANPGKYRARLTVACEQQRIELLVEAELLAPASTAPTLIRTSTGTGSERHAAVVSNGGPTPAPVLAIPAELQVDLQRPKGVRLTRLEATRATLEWPTALTAEEKFRFERRRIALEAGALKVLWEEVPGVAVERTNAVWTAAFSELRGGQVYGIRVVPLGPAGEAGKPLFTQFFSTPPAPKLLPEITLFRVLIVILAICGVLIFRQRRALRAGR